MGMPGFVEVNVSVVGEILELQMVAGEPAVI